MSTRAQQALSGEHSSWPRTIPFSRPDISEEEIAAVVNTLRSGWLSIGPETQAFEAEFAGLVSARHAIGVSSATAGLHLGLNALGVGAGDEVLVPTFTFASTGATVVHAGAYPRLVDCDPEHLNIDLSDAARKCTRCTKVVVPVHFAGHPCPMDEVQGMAAERELAIVEDAAHALPAKYHGRSIGSLSPITVFSFYATKNITTGEGGMVTTDDAVLAERVRGRRLHGMTREAWRRYSGGPWRYDISYPGFKYNMTDIAAALGRVQLKRLPVLQARREALVGRYQSALADLEEIELPVSDPGIQHAWHLYVVRLQLERLRISRDEVIRCLNDAGIGTSVHFVPLHQHSYYRDVLGYRDEQFPHATAAAERIISLPLYSRMEPADVDYVAETLRAILRYNRR